MAEAAMVVTSRQQLAERLANWPGGEEATWALVFVGAIPSAAELAAAREAAKVCDRVAAVVLRPFADAKKALVVGPKMAEVCRSAGVDVLWVAKEAAGFVKVDCGVEGVDGTLLAQALVTVLPTLVVAHRGEVRLVRALRNIQGGLGSLFSLRLAGGM